MLNEKGKGRPDAARVMRVWHERGENLDNICQNTIFSHCSENVTNSLIASNERQEYQIPKKYNWKENTKRRYLKWTAGKLPRSMQGWT